jgi:hypothetical protein
MEHTPICVLFCIEKFKMLLQTIRPSSWRFYCPIRNDVFAYIIFLYMLYLPFKFDYLTISKKIGNK